jgi:hypothetical protein
VCGIRLCGWGHALHTAAHGSTRCVGGGCAGWVLSSGARCVGRQRSLLHRWGTAISMAAAGWHISDCSTLSVCLVSWHVAACMWPVPGITQQQLG